MGDNLEDTDEIIPTEIVEIITLDYVIDYISGVKVKSTPEEVEAVQVFSKKLVEDFEYPKQNIQTHPQFRVRKRPSDNEKTYPVDIAVFKNDNKIEENL